METNKKLRLTGLAALTVLALAQHPVLAAAGDERKDALKDLSGKSSAAEKATDSASTGASSTSSAAEHVRSAADSTTSAADATDRATSAAGGATGMTPEDVRGIADQAVQNALIARDQEPSAFALGALILGVLALVLALIALVCALRKGSDAKRAARVRQQMDADREHLEQRLAGCEDEILRLGDEVAALRRSASPAPARAQSYAVAPAPSYQAPAAPTAPRPVVTEAMRYEAFIKAYNERRIAAAGATGLAVRNIRDDFINEYQLRGISCANDLARMQQPGMPAAFAEQGIGRADFWAYALPGGRYAVVPSFREYTQELHAQGGGSDAFDSNFRGTSSHNITVLRPAIFQGLTTVEQKGQLQLS